MTRYGHRVTGVKTGPWVETDRGRAYPEGERFTYVLARGDAQIWIEIVDRHDK